MRVLQFLLPATILILSRNIPVALYALFSLTFLNTFVSGIDKKYIATTIFFMFFFPDSYTGSKQLVLGQNILLIVHLFFLFRILILGLSIKSLERYGLYVKWILLAIGIVGLVLYYPILHSTYIGDELVGRETDFVSNRRESHMLSFVFPLFLGPLLYFNLLSSVKVSPLKIIIQTVQFFSVIGCILSVIQFSLNFSFFPQQYGEVVFFGGRMTGFYNPDANGFGRSLILPWAVTFYQILKGERRLLNISFLLLYFICILLTGSRSTLISTSVVSVLLLLYEFRWKIFLFLGPISLILVPIFSSLMLRGESSLSASGREIIYLSSLEAIMHSPWVGLRPGGWITYLSSGATFLGTTLRVQSSHSFYLETALNWGIPMLVLIFTFILYHIKYVSKVKLVKSGVMSVKTDSESAIIFRIVLVAYLIHGVVEIVPTYYFFFVCAAALLTLKSKYE